MATPHLNVITKAIAKLAIEGRRGVEDLRRSLVEPARAVERATALSAKLAEIIKDDLQGNVYFPDKHASLLPEVSGWVITPISGLRNLQYGRNDVATLFGFMRQGQLVAGAAWFPALDSTVMVAVGEGASESSRLRVNNRVELKESLLLLPWATSDILAHKLLEKAEAHGLHTRKSGLLLRDVADVAGGRADALVATRVTPLEAVLADAIIREAGGFVTDMQGQPVTLATTTLVAANSKLHGKVLKALHG
ncbi:MAG: inositol monophosphatase family protein [Alphaproteobacteria bacterium]